MNLNPKGYIRLNRKLLDQNQKKCSNCKQIKIRTEFSKNAGEWDGLGSLCLECKKISDQAWHKQYQQKQKHLVFEKYSSNIPECECCGETAIEFLSLDHIEGGGRQH